jgi:DNA polymerase III subunit gamma/tau
MSYQVLARKWRPKSFATLVGQDHVVRALSNALDQQRLHHAYLFTGTRGVGKTTLSRILAKSLNCEQGISSSPCGVCSACVAIDKGSFIDYIEMDAASNRGIEDMTSLLEKAVYAPTQGRFKVYMLDEVHQLTGHAFNAMLKTLEEPPAHVKFILATTDPQKMPVTILSRCLQFNLRQMASSSITEHLQKVLNAENIPFEPVALHLIAKAAAGSMRDALSLLDQAIAYGGNAVHESEVRAMLGAIDQSYLYQLLQALIAQDAHALMQQAQAMEQRSLSFDGALNDLANVLQQVSIAQVAPDSLALDLPDRGILLELAQSLSPEELQLYYQIAILARRDLGLAPDEFAGFTMALLRMLAFRPQDSSAQQAKAPATKPVALAAQHIATAHMPVMQEVAATQATSIQPAPATGYAEEPSAQIAPTAYITFDGHWRGLVDQLKLGLARALAQHCELLSHDEHSITLSVAEHNKHLLEASYQDKLRNAIEQHFARKMQLKFEIGGSGNTPAEQMQQEKSALQSQAVEAIQQDDFVQALVKDFGAQIIPSSIKPIQ